MMHLESVQRLTSSEAQCIIGHARCTSEITQETAVLRFGVLHRGEHHLYGGAHVVHDADGDQSLLQPVRTALMRADGATVIRLLHDHFGPSAWPFRALRRDAQRQIVPLIMGTTLAAAETLYRQLYEPRIPLLHTLTRLHMPVPKALRTAAEYVVSLDVQRAFAEEDLDLMRCRTLLEDSRAAHLPLDAATLQPPISQALLRLVTRLASAPSDLTLLQTLTEIMQLVSTLPFSVELWKVQNVFYTLCQTAYPAFRQKAAQDDPQARLWVHHCHALGDLLAVCVEPS